MTQISKTAFNNLYGSSGTTFPDNTTGAISEGDMRQFGQDMSDSFLSIQDNFIDDDTMATASATKVPSSESTKAYVDFARFNRKTTSYTLALSDLGKIVEMNVSTANDLTVPPESSVLFQSGSQIHIIQYGAGQTTIVAGSGVTIRSDSGRLKIAARYTGATLIKCGTNEWYLVGSLTV